MNRTGQDEISIFTVAIIGGGFAGTALAAQMLRQSPGNTSVVLVERCSGEEHDRLSRRSGALSALGAA